MFTFNDFAAARDIVYAAMPPTPQYVWPVIAEATGCELWVKHENHTPIGAFKVRGGLVYMRRLRESGYSGGIISATRGNHGQSLPYAGRRENIPVTIVVPEGNSVEKNAAMRALGADLIETGADFDDARTFAQKTAVERGLEMVPSFHPYLVTGVATYAHELFTAAGALDAVYVPIGLGSGICGTIAMRDMLGLATEVIGVVARGAPAYAHSFEAGRPLEGGRPDTFADGVAVRVPDPDALAIIRKGAARIVTVSDDEIAAAMRLYFRGAHTLAEGAGAASLAALMQEREAMRGRRVGVILSGGNIDRALYLEILGGG